MTAGKDPHHRKGESHRFDGLPRIGTPHQNGPAHKDKMFRRRKEFVPESRIRKHLRKLGRLRASSLVSKSTNAEKFLQKILLASGISFIFQKPFLLGRNIRVVDFYFPDHFTAVELDGSWHDRPDSKVCDMYRAEEFRVHAPHIRFLRYKNHEVHAQGFLARIMSDIEIASSTPVVDI